MLWKSNTESKHFIHIGKTGGSTLKSCFKNWNVEEVVLHGHKFTLRDLKKKDKAFFFLRHPLSRFVSGFYSRKRKGQPLFYNPWSTEEKIAFDYFHSPNHLAVSLYSSNVSDKAEEAMKSINHVKTSYFDWFIDEKYFLSRIENIFFIGFQENFQSDFVSLCRKLNINHVRNLRESIPIIHSNSTNFNMELSHEAKDNLRKWYKRDIEFYNLCKLYLSKYVN